MVKNVNKNESNYGKNSEGAKDSTGEGGGKNSTYSKN